MREVNRAVGLRILFGVTSIALAVFFSSVTSTGCGTNSSPVDAGFDAGSDAGPMDAGPSWSAPVTIDSSSDAGFELTYAVDPSGNPAIAYFRNTIVNYTQTDGGTGQLNQDFLVVARETSPGTWSQEVVPANTDGGALTGHYGLGLAFDPSGNPAVAYLGGQDRDSKSPPDERWHDFITGTRLPSDSMMAQKSGGTWKVTDLGNASDSYVHSGYALDDQGGIIGLWSAIAIGGDGIVHVVQRDVHFASAAGDYDDSNLEYGQFNNGTKAFGELITSRVGGLTDGGPPPPCAGADAGVACYIHGGGTYNHIVLINGEPAVMLAQATASLNDANGIWMAMRTGPATWTRAQISAVTGAPGHGPSLAYNSTGGFAVGLLDAVEGDLVVATSSDGINWSSNTVEALGETGYHPAVAWGNAGLGVLYAYCHSPIDPQGQCNPSTQELRFRLPGANGPQGAWNAPEHIDSSVPDATVLIADGQGNYVAVWRDPLLGVRASRRSP